MEFKCNLMFDSDCIRSWERDLVVAWNTFCRNFSTNFGVLPSSTGSAVPYFFTSLPLWIVAAGNLACTLAGSPKDLRYPTPEKHWKNGGLSTRNEVLITVDSLENDPCLKEMDPVGYWVGWLKINGQWMLPKGTFPCRLSICIFFSEWWFSETDGQQGCRDLLKKTKISRKNSLRIGGKKVVDILFLVSSSWHRS